jgi:hypothetical protein
VPDHSTAAACVQHYIHGLAERFARLQRDPLNEDLSIELVDHIVTRRGTVAQLLAAAIDTAMGPVPAVGAPA